VVSGQDPTDGELLQMLRRDPQAVGVLYDRYALRLVRYLQQQGAREDVALDATQEMFARLIVQGRRVGPSAEGTIWPWLAVSGRNLVRDWQRRGAVESKARHRLGLPLSPDEMTDPLARVEATQLDEGLNDGLARLSPDQRTAVTARVLQERDYSEIASATGASEATVRRRVSRGLRAMQKFLEGGNS
jgi:RNA polymerase sigma-70 factor (ECF subfamily)